MIRLPTGADAPGLGVRHAITVPDARIAGAAEIAPHIGSTCSATRPRWSTSSAPTAARCGRPTPASAVSVATRRPELFLPEVSALPSVSAANIGRRLICRRDRRENLTCLQTTGNLFPATSKVAGRLFCGHGLSVTKVSSWPPPSFSMGLPATRRAAAREHTAYARRRCRNVARVLSGEKQCHHDVFDGPADEPLWGRRS